MNDFDFEKNFWNNCTNTFNEEVKQYSYATHMGLTVSKYNIIIEPKRILDIGGGPCSMLLKVPNLIEGKVIDPIVYPTWTRARYEIKNIRVEYSGGENFSERGWDEVWMYNCLQHTEDPKKIIDNCLKSARIFRIFEWIDIPPHEGHPQMLTKKLLDDLIGVDGNTKYFNGENECFGNAYFSSVLTDERN